MAPIRLMLAVSLMIVCIAVSGCIGQPGADNRTKNISYNITTSPSFSPIVQTECPVPVNTTCPVWLTMNPIQDHQFGEVFEVNGTIQQMNWTVENAAVIHIQMECSFPGYRIIWPKGIAIQQPGNCEVKKWSYQVNLSKESSAGECVFFADTIEECGSRGARFNVTPINSDLSFGDENL